MNRNLKILISSIAIGVVIWFFALSDIWQAIPVFSCDGLACVGTGILFVFITVILVPLVFGIFGFFSTAERRLKQALISFGVSFIGMMLLLLPIFIWDVIKTKTYLKHLKQELPTPPLKPLKK